MLKDEDFISPREFRKAKNKKYREVVSISDLINNVSENTRLDVIIYFQIPESKVITIFPGVDSSCFYSRSAYEIEKIRKKYVIANKYLLYIGDFSGRKNTERLVLAYSSSQARKNHDLVLAGSCSYLGSRTIEAIKMKSLSNKVKLLEYVAEGDLAVLYSGAVGFVFPTLYEGFGFPILESMLCSTPVLTSNTGSASEIANGFASLVYPYCIDSISKGIDTLIDRKNFDILSAKDYASQFSWDVCA